MMFTDYIFWVFLAIVLTVLLAFRNSPRGRNIYLLLVSLGYYCYSGGLTVAVLLFVTASDYFIARGIASAGKQSAKKSLVCLSVLTDVLLLCYFKYSGYVTGLLNDMFSLELKSEEVFPYSTFVPIGISYFIFKNIGYTVDVYRGKVAPVRNFADFAMFTTFFPAIMSGPIMRADQFIPQIHRKYSVSREEFGMAVFWIINGLAKKIILGDYLASNLIDRVFDHPTLFTAFETLSAVFGFSLQLYADFSGYTDIAIGVAILLGFSLPKNFDSPYKSTDAQVFWKRWHISLSSWLQEYLYFPLGGNRKISSATIAVLSAMTAIFIVILKNKTAAIICLVIAAAIALYYLNFKNRRKKVKGGLNTMVTMLLGGLWHGASSNFLVWGGINGIGIIISRLWKDANWVAKLTLTFVLASIAFFLKTSSDDHVVNLLFIWASAIFAATLLRFLYHISGLKPSFSYLAKAWAVLQTFVFMSFAWVFFRTSSFNDAVTILSQIGNPLQWDLSVIPDIVESYWKVFAVFLGGLIIHFIPEKTKGWYRMKFAMLPLPLMAIAVIAALFIITQFSSAEPHPFIYFQF